MPVYRPEVPSADGISPEFPNPVIGFPGIRAGASLDVDMTRVFGSRGGSEERSGEGSGEGIGSRSGSGSAV